MKKRVIDATHVMINLDTELLMYLDENCINKSQMINKLLYDFKSKNQQFMNTENRNLTITLEDAATGKSATAKTTIEQLTEIHNVTGLDTIAELLSVLHSELKRVNVITIKDLIKQLQQFDENLEVHVNTNKGREHLKLVEKITLSDGPLINDLDKNKTIILLSPTYLGE
jgi:hypothetical protein